LEDLQKVCEQSGTKWKETGEKNSVPPQTTTQQGLQPSKKTPSPIEGHSSGAISHAGQAIASIMAFNMDLGTSNWRQTEKLLLLHLMFFFNDPGRFFVNNVFFQENTMSMV
jgi:hypothetical protein